MRKRYWRMMAFALAAVLTGCGADGRNLESRQTQETDTQAVSAAQGVENAQEVPGTQKEKDVQESAGTQVADALMAQVLSEMPDAQKNWMGGLTEEQRLNDFASLCDGLRENYPYVKLAKRQAGADLDALETAYRARVAACPDDNAYYETVKDFVREFSFTGHLELWGYRYESELAYRRKIAQEPGQEEKLEPYIRALDNPVSHKTYAAMTAFYQDVEILMEEKRADASGGNRGESAQAETGNGQAQETAAVEETVAANVVTKVLEPGETAYVSIGIFEHGQMEEDSKILLPFYEEVRDYENLIIDITDNPGGSMRYFDELVAAPLARETLTVPTYQLFKDGENNKMFLRVEEGAASGRYYPISEIPAMPHLNREDAADCDWFLREDYTVEPAGEGFAGKIWLLVNEKNYSSSEYAAMFAKASGFATLVGRTTGGDGIGTDPVYLILPDSGLVVQYSPMYGVSADGTGSEEYGTEPDIVSPEGESALETCLRYIEEEY